MQDVKKWTHKDDFQGGKMSGVTLEKKVSPSFSVYLLYWYKSTSTDASCKMSGVTLEKVSV
jgi:hypothetical protein